MGLYLHISTPPCHLELTSDPLYFPKDHIGGHIKSSRHAPSETLDHKDLARQLQGAEKVVFHCALSQQRGPSAALKYLREREKLLGADLSTKATTGSIDGESKERDENENENEKVKKQEIYVLDGGFVRWQEKYIHIKPCGSRVSYTNYNRYGDDERLTENYNKQLWADGGNY